jgi:hypothetical protein
MTDFRIRRCRIRAVRTAGAGALWSTRDDRIAIGRRVQRLVLGALDELLSANWQGPDELHLARPLHVEVPINVRDLLVPVPLARQRLREPLQRALSNQIVAGMREMEASRAREESVEVSPTAERSSAAPISTKDDAASSPFLALLVRWLRKGDLVRQLQFLDDIAVAQWYASVEDEVRARRIVHASSAFTAEAASAGAGSAAELAEIDASISVARVEAGVQDNPLRSTFAQRLHVLAQLQERGFELSSRVLQQVESRLPLPPPQSTAQQITVAHGERSEAKDRSSPARRTIERPAQPEMLLGTFHAEHVLPFLLLGPLHQSHWLTTLDAALRASGTTDLAAAVAFALAVKVLPPPARGWHHTPAALNSAALVAGMRDAIGGDQLSVASRSVAVQLGALDGAVASALLGGHSEDWPYLLAEHNGRVALFEMQGLTPVAMAASWDELLSRLRGERLTCFVPRTLAAPELLRKLAATGRYFIAVGAPGRGESWARCISSGGIATLTNVPEAKREHWRRRVDACNEASERTTAVLDELIAARPISASPAPLRLAESSALAASLALGEMGWLLAQADWQAWAHPDPLLVLERFGSLSGRVHFRDDCIDVVLPLGARFRDLRDARLLERIPNVPWFGRRSVGFHGG